MQSIREYLDLLIFDMAGTTVQVADEVSVAFVEAFGVIGMKVLPEEIDAVRGRSKHEAIADILKEKSFPIDRGSDVVDRVYVRFQESLLNRYRKSGIQPVQGTKDTFDWLSREGIKIALTTGFSKAIADLIVDSLGWGKITAAVVSNDDVPKGRPAPYLIFRAMEWTGVESVHRVAVVGDTIADLTSAANAGVSWSIGVLSGAHTRTQLQSCPHTAIIESVAELPRLFRNKIPIA